MEKPILQLCAVIWVLGATATFGFAKDTMARLADGHADACLYNYNECMTGCDGASGCESQCQANYDGCMGEGQ